MTESHRTHENNASSIFKKLTPDLRRAVDVAIVERVPPTFQAVWMNFKLGELGVTYSAFYRYARRLRDRANLVDSVALADDEDADVDESIRKLLSRRLLEILLNTDDAAAIKEIATLTSAHRQVSRTALQDRQITEKSRIAWARVENEREQLRIKLEQLLAFRSRRGGPQGAALPPGQQSSALIGGQRSSASSDAPDSRKGLQKLLELIQAPDRDEAKDRSNPNNSSDPEPTRDLSETTELA